MEKTQESPKEEAPVVDLAAEARKEWEASRKEPDSEESAPDESQPDEAKAEPQESEEAKPLVDATEKSEEVKTPEEKPVEEVPVVEDKVVEEWAIKHGMTMAEAKEDLEKTKGVVQKYKSPEEMARALRLMQREYEKAKQDKTAEPERDQYQISPNPRLEVQQYVQTNADEIVNKYRQSYPARSRDMEDDAILEDVTEKLYTGYEQFNRGRVETLKSDANRRREELLSSLNESDRRFLPDVKAVLDKTSDRTLMSRQFSLNDIVYWAKGQRFDDELKKAREQAMKEAKEQPKILGTLPSQRTETSQTTKKGGVRLSEYEKRLARDMFATTTFTDEEKYEAYIDVSRKNKKK